MKELGMSWSEIKRTPRHELTGLIVAMSNYNQMHSFDGYTDDEISTMAKDKPQIRSQYAKYVELNANYEARAGTKKKVTSFSDLMTGVS